MNIDSNSIFFFGKVNWVFVWSFLY
jgi:hypothetical protein